MENTDLELLIYRDKSSKKKSWGRSQHPWIEDVGKVNLDLTKEVNLNQVPIMIS